MNASQRPFVVALLPCCGKKLQHAAPARDLYASPWFRLMRQWIEQQGLPWGIVSARHGLVMPDAVLEPYEQRLTARDRAAFERWRVATHAQIVRKWPRARIVSLLPGLYATCLRGLWTLEPMRGLGLFGQMEWLKANTK